MTRMFSSEARYRTIDEAGIIDLLLFQGWAFEERAGGRAAAEQEAKATLDRFVAMGLPHQVAKAGARRFDPAEVHNFVKWAGIERGEPTWRERFVATTRRLVCEAQLACGRGGAIHRHALFAAIRRHTETHLQLGE